MIKTAKEIKQISADARARLNLTCNNELLEAIEYEINDSARKGGSTAYICVKDKNFYDDGFTPREIDCVKEYLGECLGYNVQYSAATGTFVTGAFQICVSW